MTSEEQIWADYQFAPGEAALPTYFVQLLKYAMAAEIAETVTGLKAIKTTDKSVKNADRGYIYNSQTKKYEAPSE